MKATGIMRKFDGLGRVVMPSELRTMLGIKKDDAVEFFTEGKQVIIKKYEPFCTFCSGSKEVTSFKGSHIYGTCLQELRKP
jgi:transcriptional pleiotropic regulator of transition state genes